MNNKVILVILDGWGMAPAWGGNAVELAETHNFDNYWRKYPHASLNASEEAVGLPRHEPGNSEVGHLNIGCGQNVKQNLPGITLTIKDKSFFENQILLGAVENAKKKESNIHLIGMVSDGGIHSHNSHLYALLDLFKKRNFTRVYIHMITDGRDTDPMKALSFLEELQDKIDKLKIGRVETVMGRFYAMDRDNRWNRVKSAYEALTLGVGPRSESPQKAISESYRKGQYDEFITPTIIENNEKFVPIKENDSIIFFNFRSDRAKELTWAFVKKDFQGFQRQKYYPGVYFATFAFHEEYEENLPVKVVFRPEPILNPLAEVFEKNNLKQFHIAETEKYAHVTHFFNGSRDTPFKGEERMLIPSPKVATYDLKPEMSAAKVKEEIINKHHNFDFTIANFANPDMVGHTGNIRSTIKACEFVDLCLGEVVKNALAASKIIIVTADHGNAEQMINPNTGEAHTEHTVNPVPFLIISADPKFQNPLRQQKNGTGLSLSDIAPTILQIMNLPAPKEMTGKSIME